MVVAIAILLLTWPFFHGGLSTSNTNQTLNTDQTQNTNQKFPGPMLDLIKLYAKHAAWYTQNRYDGYGDQHYDFDQCLKYHRELEELVVPRYMNKSDLYNLLNFIYRKSEQTQRKRGRGPENLWQLMVEAKSEFKNSTFAPSEYMIEHIEKLAEHSAWVALNDRAGYGDKRNDIRKIEEHYQALLAKKLEIVKIVFDENEGDWRRDDKPKIMKSCVVDNESGSRDMNADLKFSTSIVEETRFSETLHANLGFKRSVEGNFGAVKLSAEVTIEFGRSETNEVATAKTESHEIGGNCTAAAGEEVRCIALFNTTTADIPYTITYRIDDKHEIDLKGTWHGVISHSGRFKKELLSLNGIKIDSKKKTSQESGRPTEPIPEPKTD